MERDRKNRQAAQHLFWGKLLAPRRGRRDSLTVDDIVNAALVVGQRVGMDNLSMPAVAEALGVGVASLYTYVPHKAGLFALISDTMIGMLPLPHTLPGDWRAQTQAWALDEMATFRAYPWLIDFEYNHMVGPKAVVWLDSAARVFEDTGLTADQALTVVNTVSAYIRGHIPQVLDEDRTRTDAEPRDIPAETRAEAFRKRYLYADEHYPALESITDYPSAMTVFEAGLEWLLDGVSAQITARNDRS